MWRGFLGLKLWIHFSLIYNMQPPRTTSMNSLSDCSLLWSWSPDSEGVHGSLFIWCRTFNPIPVHVLFTFPILQLVIPISHFSDNHTSRRPWSNEYLFVFHNQMSIYLQISSWKFFQQESNYLMLTFTKSSISGSYLPWRHRQKKYKMDSFLRGSNLHAHASPLVAC